MCGSSAAPPDRTSSSTVPSPEPALGRYSLVCEQAAGWLFVAAAWPAVEVLDCPAFYPSGPLYVLTTLTAQQRERSVSFGAISSGALE